MQSLCCWPPERAVAGLSSRSFISSHKAAWVRLRSRISSSLVAVPHSGQLKPVGHIFPNRPGKRQREREHHSHTAAQGCDIGAGIVDVFAVQQNPPGHAGIFDHIVEPVNQTQQGCLSASRRPEKNGYGAGRHLQCDVSQGLKIAVKIVYVLNEYFRLYHCRLLRK